MDKVKVITTGITSLVLLQMFILWVCYHHGARIRNLIANVDRLLLMLKASPPPMLEASKGHEWTKCTTRDNRPHPSIIYPPPKEAPMQDEPQTAAGETTALHSIAASAQAKWNSILDKHATLECDNPEQLRVTISTLRVLLDSELVSHLERDLAHQALDHRETINQLTDKSERLENQILGLTQQHKAELETLDEMHTRKLDQSVRATVAVVLEQVGQRSITLDLGKIQTVWHRLDLSMHLVPGDSMAVKYTIDHYKASN